MPGRHRAPSPCQTKRHRRSIRQKGEPATAQFRFVASSLQEILMITQPNPQLEARPATPDAEHRHLLHLPGRPHLRPALKDSRSIDTHIPNIALAGLQLLLGYEWLLAGGDKLLLGKLDRKSTRLNSS